MSDQSCSPLFALVDAAISLRPIPAPETDGASSSTITSRYQPRAQALETTSAAVAAVSKDERPHASPCSSPGLPSTFDPSPRKKSAPLPVILMELLTASHADRDGGVVSFLPDGQSFTVLRPHAFANGLMPRLFRCVKLPTFIKKLEKWGFRRILGGEKLVFTHPLFRMGDWDSCRKIRSSKSKGASSPSPSLSPPASPPRRLSPPVPEMRALRQLGPVSPKDRTMETQRMTLRRALHSRDQTGLLAKTTAAPSASAAASLRGMVARQRARQNVLRRQHAQRETAMVSTARHQSRQRALSPLPSSASCAGSFSQEEVDRATRSIMGAAMDVLARDKDIGGGAGRGANFVDARPCRSSPPLLAREMSAAPPAAAAAAAVSPSEQVLVAAMVSEERLSVMRMEAELATARKAEREAQLMLASRRRQAHALLMSAAIGAR